MSGKERKPSTKTYVFLITYGILLYLGLQNFSAIKSVFSWAYAIMQPISYGVCIAFIINLFLRFFRERVFVGMANSHRPWERKLCPVISAVCTGLVAMILLALIIFMIIPQLTTAVNTLIEKLPSSLEQIYDFVKAKLTAWNAPAFLIEKLDDFHVDWDTLYDWINKFADGKVGTFLGSAFSVTTSVLSTATNFVLGLIIAIYLLAQKDRVMYVLHKVVKLISPARYYDRITRILHLANRSFASFLTGQFIEAIVIGTLCTIGLYICRFPFAATIGILTGITTLLPIVGAWIGGAIGALLIATAEPDKVIWFIVFIFVLQQLDGQFIYPKIVGDSIGLPGLLVLIAVIVGAGFGGIIGIIITVPVFAILYQLLKDAIDSMPPEPEPAAAGAGAGEADAVRPLTVEDAEAQPEQLPEPEKVTVNPQPAPHTSGRKKRRRRK